MFWSSPVFLLLTGGLIISPGLFCGAEEYYVTPTQPPNPACPSGKPCHTLSDYAKNSSTLLSGKDNVSLLFLDGMHTLTGHNLEISESVNVTLAGMNTSHNMMDVPSVIIQMSNKWNVSIGIVTLLRMENLFIRSNYSKNIYFEEFVVQVAFVDHFRQNHVWVDYCTLVIQMTAEVSLHNSQYKASLIQVTNNITLPQSNKAVQFFKSSYFSMSKCVISFSTLKVTYVDRIETNLLRFKGSLYDCHCSGTSISVFSTVRHFTFDMNNCNFSAGSVGGASIAFQDASFFPQELVDSNYETSNFELNTENCTLYHVSCNFGYGVSPTVKRIIRFSSCTILDCTIYSVMIAQYSIQDSNIVGSSLFVAADATNVHVDNGNNKYSLRNVTFQECSLRLSGPANATMDGCFFESGAGNTYSISPIVMDHIDLTFAGNTVFSNNIGYRGGAMHLFYTTIYLEYGANITFINNTAEDLGGAIYMYIDGQYNPELGPGLQVANGSCFKLKYNINNSNHLNSSLHFRNNTAQNGGVNIFGPSFKTHCPITPDGKTLSNEIQNELFEFDNNSLSSLSAVSSDPKRVCLCENNEPKCASYSHIIVQDRKYTSGEKFTVSVVLVGNDFGTLTGGVHAIIDNSNYNLSHGQHFQQVDYTECTELEFSVHSKITKELQLLLVADPAIVFRPRDPDSLYDSCATYHSEGLIHSDLLITPIYLNITIAKCPLGFVLDDNLLICQCTGELVKSGINNCTVTNGTGLIYRSGTTWVSHSASETDGVLIHNYCPYGYCKSDTIGVDLFHPDTQCAFDHSGILCGNCSTNLSLALGSSQCLPCTNDGHIALHLAFIIAGFALVFFIKILDLTVARGPINGLILYANIIWINQSIFFPPGSAQVLKVFIAWLNLDLGIETCFFQGLDAYWKARLQFVFPIYVWMIAGFIIIFCRYSPKATKLFGNNSVHVLATLFLLSYVKLLRTIVTALGFAILHYPEGNRIVWLFDGNLQYFELRHSFLFVAALLALFILWLPYTAALLLVPYLRKNSNHLFLSWINKWKPLFDAYYGPLKDKHQYWIGLTLLVRVVLAVVAVAIQAIAPKINILLVVITSAILVCLLYPVYKKSYIFFLEASSLLNLIIVSGGILCTDNPPSRIILVQISVAISFITFLSIVTLLGYFGLKDHCRKHKASSHLYTGYENLDNAPRIRDQPVTRSIVSVNNRLSESNQLREPLLESQSES